MLNNPADMLSIVLRGTLGRSGRKRARKASRFLTGNRGFLSTSAMIRHGRRRVGHLRHDQGARTLAAVPGVPPVPNVPEAGFGTVPPVPGAAVPTLPAAFEAALDPVARVIRLAVSAAKADGTLVRRRARVDHGRAPARPGSSRRWKPSWRRRGRSPRSCAASPIRR